MSYVIELYQWNNLPKTFLRQSNFFCSSFELGLGSRMATIDLNIGLHQIRIVSTFVLTGRKAKYTRSKLRNFFSEKGAFSDFNGRPFKGIWDPKNTGAG